MNQLFVAFALVLVSLSQGSMTLCPQEDMEFYPHTHSCFIFKRYKMDFPDCRYECEDIKGTESNEKGYVGRIFDSETNTFIKGKIRSKTYWIGLTDSAMHKDHRWDGYTKIKPNYFDWIGGSPSSYSYSRYTVINSDGWKKVHKNSYYYCLCEAKAEIPPLRMTSPLPLQIGQKSEKAVTCSIGYKWSELSWYLPSQQEISRCYVQIDGARTCRSYVSGYAGTVTGNTESVIEITNVKRIDHGRWKCVVRLDGETLGEQTQDVRVFEAAKDIVCNHSLSPSGVEVICETPRIYPEGQCSWEYKDSNEDYIHLTDIISDQNEKSMTYVDQDSMLHQYNATCVLNLRLNQFGHFKAGPLTVRVAIDPHISNLHKVASYASVSREHVVNIELPRPPKFKFPNGTRVTNPASLTLTTHQDLTLICFVYHGQPRVLHTYLDCEFSFNGGSGSDQVSEYSEKRQAVSVVMKVTINKAMDGKTCHCYGEHLTGFTDSTEMTFHVEWPPSIIRFSPNSRSDQGDDYAYIYTEGAEIDLNCLFDGNPVPTLSMRRAASTQALAATLIKNTIKHRIQKASCSDNGDYICQASNTVAGNVTTITRTLRLGVSCYPTLCNSEDDNQQFGANIGKKARIRLCLNGHPTPRVDLFKLIYDTKRRAMGKSEYSIDYVTSSFSKGELSIDIPLKDDSFGDYHVEYNGNTRFALQVVLKGAPFCPSDARVVESGLNHLRIEWTQDTSHEEGESFIIFGLDDADKGHTELDEIVANETQHRVKMNYDLRGLEPGRTYTLTVGTRNTHGVRVCRDQWFNGTTEALEGELSDKSSDASVSSLGLVLIVVLLIVLVIILLVALFLWRRKKQRNNRRLAVKMDPRRDTAAIANDTDDDEDEDGNVEYAKVNKKNINKFKGPPDNAENTYSNFSPAGAHENVYSNQVQPTVDDGAVYANSSNAQGNMLVGNETPSSSRGRDLIYISVTVDPNDKVTMNEGGEEVQGGGGGEAPKYDPVEYSCIDIAATKAKQAEDEEINRMKEGEEDELLYEEDEEETDLNE